VRLVPFLLDGFGDKREFFQADGIHPNAQAQAKIVENVWKILRTMLASAPNRPPTAPVARSGSFANDRLNRISWKKK
jgi:acyl-CoA thioesterase-1